MAKLPNENKQYFQTNAELAKENSDLHIQLQRSTKMNNLLLQQSFEIRSKLAEVSMQNYTLAQKNQAYKRKLIEFKEQSKVLLDAIQQVHLSPISEREIKKMPLEKPATIAQLANSFEMVDLLGKEKKHKQILQLEVIPEEPEEQTLSVNTEAESPININQDKISDFQLKEKSKRTVEIAAKEKLEKGPKLLAKHKVDNVIHSLQTEKFQNRADFDGRDKSEISPEFKPQEVSSEAQSENSKETQLIPSQKSSQSQTKQKAPSNQSFPQLYSLGKRARKIVNYKLPNLHSKLRKGDPFTDDFGS
jgi:hypothetical protein